MNTSEKCVMVVDMAQFSKIQDHYKSLFGADGEAKISTEIKKILTDGFEKAGLDYKRSLLKFEGDGGIFVFDNPEHAHHAGVGILEITKKHNEIGQQKRSEFLLRCFRVGVSFGEFTLDEHQEANSTAITVATRLEGSGKPDNGGCSGEIRICPETYRRLPEALRRLYGGEEMVKAKKHDGVGGKIPAHRLTIAPKAFWETNKVSAPQKNKEFASPPPAEPPPKKLLDCFVISPIEKYNKRIADVFEKLIEPACKESGFQARRADHIPGSERLLVITKQLSTVPLVIAYLGEASTNWNDDVMLEIGYRLSTGMPLIMISDELPPPKKGQRDVSFKEILPFHLAQTNVIQAPKNPRLIYDELLAEIKTTLKQRRRDQWSTIHPVMELRFSNVKEDLALTYVSPEAKELFGFEETSTPDLEAMMTRFKERMDEAQHKAYLKERFEIMARIRDQGLGMDMSSVPEARVPLIFKDQQQNEGKPGWKPTGYLPIISRFLYDKGILHLQLLYLKVSSCLQKDPGGYWVCDL